MATPKHDYLVSTMQTSLKSAALAAASKIADNEEINTTLTTLSDAQETTNISPVMLYSMILKVFGEGDVLSMPVPYSEYKAGANTPFDIYYFKEGNREKKYGFYEEVFSHLRVGREINTALAGIAKALENQASAPEPYASYSPGTLKSEGHRLRVRRDTGTDNLRMAVGLVHQLKAFTDNLDKVRVSFVKKDDGKVVRGKKAIQIINPEDVGDAIQCSVSQFLNYNPARAAAHGGTVAAVRKSGKIEEPAVQKKDKTGGRKVNTPEEMVETIYAMLGFLKQYDPAAMTRALTRLSSGDEGDDVVTAIGDLFDAVQPLYAVVSGRYEDLTRPAAKKAV